jgi:YD repeat-containing protein
MKNRLFVLLLFGLFITICCEKEQTPVIENVGLPLIVKEIYSDDLYHEFTYNEQNLLKERKSKWFYTLYHYDVNNRLTSADMYEDPGIFSSNWVTSQAAWNRTDWVNPENTNKSAITSYTYKNQMLESIIVLRIPGGAQNKSTFEYGEKGRIVNEIFYSEGEVSGRIAYTYDDSGNVSREEHFWGAVLASTRLFEYDNKHNPFFVFGHLLTPGIYTNENNIIRETQTLANNTDPNIETVHVTESVYEYNDQGYPVTKNGYIRYEYK